MKVRGESKVRTYAHSQFRQLHIFKVGKVDRAVTEEVVEKHEICTEEFFVSAQADLLALVKVGEYPVLTH